MRIERAIQRLRELSEGVSGTTAVRPKLELYEKTLRELVDVTPDDDDEGILVVTEWIEDYVDEDGTFPPSRAVRDRAAKYCRANGYELTEDSWLVT
jgi:hypothetical protein